MKSEDLVLDKYPNARIIKIPCQQKMKSSYYIYRVAYYNSDGERVLLSEEYTPAKAWKKASENLPL